VATPRKCAARKPGRRHEADNTGLAIKPTMDRSVVIRRKLAKAGDIVCGSLR